MKTTNNHNIVLGGRYFNVEENDDGTVRLTSLLKVIGVQNEDVYRVQDLISKTIFKVHKTFLLREYALLEPDAYVLFNIVDLQDGIQDVIVTMFRHEDMKENNTVPYCVCRQNITNLYSAMIRTQDVDSYTSKEVGMCMAIDSIPDGVDYTIMTACNDISSRHIVASYLDDTLDMILSCIKSKRYDKVLENLFQDHMKHVSEVVNPSDPIHMGYCRTLKTLLSNNDFMYDYKRAFDIVDVGIDLDKEIQENSTLSPFGKDTITKVFNKIINGESLLKFDKDIDLESIKQQYVLLCDIRDSIYIMTYIDQEDIPVYETVSSEPVKEDPLKLLTSLSGYDKKEHVQTNHLNNMINDYNETRHREISEERNQ